jgi:hypothetical protein
LIEASCHCGAVRFTVEAAPDELNDCQCSICRRLGALWAYYVPSQVRFAADSGPTDTYIWNERILAFHRCRTCGCVTHWSPYIDPAYPRMGVNGRLFPPQTVAAIRVYQSGGA